MEKHYILKAINVTINNNLYIFHCSCCKLVMHMYSNEVQEFLDQTIYTTFGVKKYH